MSVKHQYVERALICYPSVLGVASHLRETPVKLELLLLVCALCVCDEQSNGKAAHHLDFVHCLKQWLLPKWYILCPTNFVILCKCHIGRLKNVLKNTWLFGVRYTCILWMVLCLTIGYNKQEFQSHNHSVFFWSSFSLLVSLHSSDKYSCARCRDFSFGIPYFTCFCLQSPLSGLFFISLLSVRLAIVIFFPSCWHVKKILSSSVAWLLFLRTGSQTTVSCDSRMFVLWIFVNHKPIFCFCYPHDAMLARVFAIATCLSVCLSVRPSVRPSVCHTPVLCLAERKQDREMYTI